MSQPGISSGQSFLASMELHTAEDLHWCQFFLAGTAKFPSVPAGQAWLVVF